MSRFFRTIFVGLLLSASAHAVPATIYPTNGEAIEVEIAGVEKGRVLWHLPGSASNVQSFPFSRIRNIDFPAPTIWTEAMEAMDQRRYDEALKKFQTISRNRQANYWPAPGNFASLSLRKLLECHRRLLNAEQVAVLAERILQEPIPEDQKQLDAVDQLWVAAGKEDWEALLAGAEEIAGDDLGWSHLEINWLRGQALEASDRLREAASAYANIYTLSLGSQPELAEAALRRSAEILADLSDPDLEQEAQAQLSVYAGVFGGGSLWEGASEDLTAMVEGGFTPLDLATADTPGAEEDIAEPIYVIGRTDGLEPQGSVQREGGAWVFDGEDDHILLPAANPGVNVAEQVVMMRTNFEPAAPDGTLLSIGGSSRGLALILDKGEVVFLWKPEKDKDVVRRKLGPVSMSERHAVYILVGKTGELTAVLNGERIHEQISLGGGIAENPLTGVVFGGTSEEESWVLGEEIERGPFFAGKIHLFSLGTGETRNAILELEEKTLGASQPAAAPETSE